MRRVAAGKQLAHVSGVMQMVERRPHSPLEVGLERQAVPGSATRRAAWCPLANMWVYMLMQGSPRRVVGGYF